MTERPALHRQPPFHVPREPHRPHVVDYDLDEPLTEAERRATLESPSLAQVVSVTAALTCVLVGIAILIAIRIGAL